MAQSVGILRSQPTIYLSNSTMRALTVLLAVHVGLSAASMSLFSVATEYGTLTLEGHQKRGVDTHIQGVFRSLVGDGIRFRTSSKSLEIAATDGQNLVKIFSYPLSVQMYGEDEEAVVYQVMDDGYAEFKDGIYRVSSNDIPIHAAIAQGRVSHSQFLAILQARKLSDPQGTVRASIEELVNHPAIRLIEPAARALGEDLGITGRDNPAAMPFYAVAMKLAEAYDGNRPAKISRNLWDAYLSQVKVEGTYPFCNKKTCPPCQEDECMGLCGKNCSCWKFVCGDCCFHQGCADHDVCCRKEGFTSSKCLLPLPKLNFSCERYSRTC